MGYRSKALTGYRVLTLCLVFFHPTDTAAGPIRPTR